MKRFATSAKRRGSATSQSVSCALLALLLVMFHPSAAAVDDEQEETKMGNADNTVDAGAPETRAGSHLVPADKDLDPAWVAALYDRGEGVWYEGTDLETIGVPCGGIGAGQMYLCGDGRLAHWGISSGQPQSYWYRREKIKPITPVEQGFAVRVRFGGQTRTRTLDHAGFPGVRFRGEYPIGRVEYRDRDFPLAVRLEAFSPFIPLNEEDSSLPATIMRFDVTNTSEAPVEVDLLGWLDNALCRSDHYGIPGRENQLVLGDNLATMRCDLKPEPPCQKPPLPPGPPIVFEDFESEGYGDWKVSGEAFGAGPARGTLANQQNVSGYRGEGLVNTFLGGDASQGRLVSPSFTIEAPFISFLIGGGNHPDEACINLVVEGEIVRTATGANNELLVWHDWDVSDLSGKEAQIEILDQTAAFWGHINIDQIEFRHDPAPRPPAIPYDKGTLALSLAGVDRKLIANASVSGPLPEIMCRADHWEGDARAEGPMHESLVGALGCTLELPAGAVDTVDFIVTWHLPHLLYRPGYGGEPRDEGRHYARRFSDAGDVAQYVAGNLARLASQTRLWRDIYYDSTLPYWLLDRLHAPVSVLASKTCDWWRNGLFFGWEGGIQGGDVTTHVWNYGHALARLFPRLERSIREMRDLETAFDPETGAVATWGKRGQTAAADGQAGTVLKAFRDHLLSADSSYLERNWPRIRRALEYSIEQDGDDDGLIENEQFNTYDVTFHGANTFVGSLYLAALKAGDAMAREMGDDAFAERCRTIAESGRQLSMERLFSGEYFVQDVDLEKHPNHQYASGCLSDQMFGQNWAHQLHLGYIYPPEAVASALQSVWKYNWTPDVGPVNAVYPPLRNNDLCGWFAYAGDPGLINCTWPKSPHPEGNKGSVFYRDEVWTGIEYQTAAGMAWEGMTTEALLLCRAVYDRYHPARHNPWNEVEWGDHYSRGLASWGVLIALSGFEYHGPDGRIGFAPNITPADFRAVFTAAEGWGSLSQKRRERQQTNRIAVKWGRLRTRTLAFALPKGETLSEAIVTVGGRTVDAAAEQSGQRVTFHLVAEECIESGETAEVRMTYQKSAVATRNSVRSEK